MLDSALDWGITEFTFWEMTIEEVRRAVDSKRRVKKYEDREKAYFDYTQALLITKGMAKAMGGSKADYPTLEDAYPEIFKEDTTEYQAKVEEQKIILSALRFKQFTQSFNKKFNKEVANDK